MRTLVVLLLLVVMACDSNELIETRSFYMGFTIRQPGSFDAATVYESDIINYHFEGVPWFELMRGDSISNHVILKWNESKLQCPASHKVYVSASPLSEDRRNFASDVSTGIDDGLMDRPDIRTFKDEGIRSAYLKYCITLINFFNPQYFNMATDANLFFLTRPDQWPEFVQFHHYIYKQLKLIFPDVVIFSSVAAEPALQNFIPGSDYILQRLPILQLTENSDLYSVTIHPNSISALLSSDDRGEFSALFNISKKPFALSLNETNNYSGLESVNHKSSFKVDFNSSLDHTLVACLNRKAVFVVRTLERHNQRASESGLKENFNMGSSTVTSSLWRKYLSIHYN